MIFLRLLQRVGPRLFTHALLSEIRVSPRFYTRKEFDDVQTSLGRFGSMTTIRRKMARTTRPPDRPGFSATRQNDLDVCFYAGLFPGTNGTRGECLRQASTFTSVKGREQQARI